MKQRCAGALAKVLDAAVLWGTGAPASYPVGGVAAVAGPVVTGGVDALTNLDTALGEIEASGVEPTGIASSLAILGVLRAAYRATQALPGVVPDRTLYGLPVAATPNWPATGGDAIVGDWSKLLVGIRSDLRYELSTDGVLLNADNTVAVSAFAQDMTLLRVYARIGVAIGIPVGPGGAPVEPFRLVEFTGVPAGAAPPAEGARRTR